MIRSDSDKFAKGDILYGGGQHSTYAVVPSQALGGWRKLENEAKIDLKTYVGAAGMPGHTAFHGFNLSKPQKGETIFVTSAAGAVGQIVVQLAKAAGLKVIASAGDADKVAFVKELGADVAFNYKETDTAGVLAQNPFDIMWDGVGGPVLEAALEAINKRGRIIGTGAVSQIHKPTSEYYGIRNTWLIGTKELTFHGLLITNHLQGESADRFAREMPPKIAKGEIKVREHVTNSIDNGEGLIDMLTGKARGKAVVILE